MRWVLLILLVLPFAHAFNERTVLPVSVTPSDSSGVLANQDFTYDFVFTQDGTCSGVLLNTSVNLTTNAAGWATTNLDVSSLTEEPAYLCYYRNETFINNMSLFNSTFRVNTNVSGFLQNNTPASFTNLNFTNTFLNIERKAWLRSLSSGVLSGGVISVNTTDSTSFDISSGQAIIIDMWTDPDNPTIHNVSLGSAGVQVANLNNASVSFVYVDRDGNVLQTTSSPSSSDVRDYVFLGQLGHANRVTLGAALSKPTFFSSPVSQVRDLAYEIGTINDGVTLSPAGTNLSITRNGGTLFDWGSNYDVDKKSPHLSSISQESVLSFRLRTQTGNGSNNNVELDVGNYDNNGVVTAISGVRYQVFRAYQISTGNTVIQYGQETYTTLNGAIDAIPTQSFVKLENIADAVLIGLIVARSNANDLSSDSQARFFAVSRFGEAVSAAGVGLTDHGLLTGLTDDDHSQYMLVNGSRAWNGTVDYDGNNIINLADVTFQNGAMGGTLRTGPTAADKFELQGYDVNDGVYRKVLEVDAGNDVTLEVFSDSFQIWDTNDENIHVNFNLSNLVPGLHQFFFPNTNGTFALLSDLSAFNASYLVRTGDTASGNYTLGNSTTALFVDETNTRVGIGTGSPTATTHITGNLKVDYEGSSAWFDASNIRSDGVSNFNLRPTLIGSGNQQTATYVPTFMPTGTGQTLYSINMNLRFDNSTSDINNAYSLFTQAQILGDYNGTISSLYGLRVNGWATQLNSSADILNQYGVYVVDPVIDGSSNTIAYYTNMASGSGKYAFYGGGTADSSLGGSLGVGTVSPGLQLELEDNSISTAQIRVDNSEGQCDGTASSGSFTWSCSSDERLKPDIQPVDTSVVLENLKARSVCMRQYHVLQTFESDDRVYDENNTLVSGSLSYSYNTSGEWKIGYSAQCLQGVAPELVSEQFDFTGYLWDSASQQAYFVENETLLQVEMPNTNELLVGLSEMHRRNVVLRDELEFVRGAGIAQKQRIDALCALAPPGTC